MGEETKLNILFVKYRVRCKSKKILRMGIFYIHTGE
jgi:hypothetical protein